MKTNVADREAFNLYPRDDGQWIVQFKDERAGGKKKWKEHRIPRDQAHTRKQAERYARAYVAEYVRARAGEPVKVTVDEDGGEKKPPTIRSLAEKWIELREDDPKLSPAIRIQNASNMRRHVLTYREVADVPIAQLGPSVLRAWLRKVRDGGRLKKVTGDDGEKTGKGGKWVRTGEPLAAYTVRNIANTLSAFFEDSMAEEWIGVAANPMHHPGVRREIPAAETRAGTAVHLVKATAEKLITAETTPENRRARYLLAAVSGMRDGEIAGLLWNDVDTAFGTVNVTKSLASKGPEGWATMRPTKTKSGERLLPLHPLAAKALKAWKATGWAKHVGRHPKGDDYVFPNAKAEGHRPDSAGLLRADLAAAGLPTKLHDKHPYDFHALRRSFYTWLRGEGVERDTVDMLMGHSGGSVGERHYAAKDLERMRKAVDTIALDLSPSNVIAFPMRAVAGDPKPAPETECGTAILTAGRGKPSRKTERARSDSNGRHSASKARGDERTEEPPECSDVQSPDEGGIIGDVDGAGECTLGAAGGGRGTPAVDPAVSVATDGPSHRRCVYGAAIAEAVARFDAGDVAGARAVLVAVLEDAEP